MDDAQVTGACSSYARKYALNGLFCIDDTKDADATETHGKSNSDQSKATPQKDDGIMDKIIESFKIQKSLEDLNAKMEKARNTPYGKNKLVVEAYSNCAALLLK